MTHLGFAQMRAERAGFTFLCCNVKLQSNNKMDIDNILHHPDRWGRRSLQTMRIFGCFHTKKVFRFFLVFNNENFLKIVGTDVPGGPK